MRCRPGTDSHAGEGSGRPVDGPVQSPPRRCILSRGALSMRLRKQRLLSPSPILCLSAMVLLIVGVLPATGRADDSWTSFRNGPQQLGIAHAPLPEQLE